MTYKKIKKLFSEPDLEYALLVTKDGVSMHTRKSANLMTINGVLDYYKKQTYDRLCQMENKTKE